MKAIVKPRPACRHCGSPVRRFGRCPRCGRRAWLWIYPGRGPGV